MYWEKTGTQQFKALICTVSCLVTKSSEEKYNFNAMHLMWGPIFADKGSTEFCKTVSVLFLKGSSGSPPPRRTRTGHQMWGPCGTSTKEPWNNKNRANKSSRQEELRWLTNVWRCWLTVLEKIHQSLFKTRNMTWSVVFYKSFIFKEKKSFIFETFTTKRNVPICSSLLGLN